MGMLHVTYYMIIRIKDQLAEIITQSNTNMPSEYS